MTYDQLIEAAKSALNDHAGRQFPIEMTIANRTYRYPSPEKVQELIASLENAKARADANGQGTEQAGVVFAFAEFEG